MGNPFSSQAINDRVKAALEQLDLELVEIDGMKLKPSQCYHVETNPFHVLFNTNCPDRLKAQVEAILSKYMTVDEDRAPQ